MKEKLSKIQAEALEQINAADANLEEIKIKYLIQAHTVIIGGGTFSIRLSPTARLTDTAKEIFGTNTLNDWGAIYNFYQ